jgi:hypothetical protein
MTPCHLACLSHTASLAGLEWSRLVGQHHHLEQVMLCDLVPVDEALTDGGLRRLAADKRQAITACRVDALLRAGFHGVHALSMLVGDALLQHAKRHGQQGCVVQVRRGCWGASMWHSMHAEVR